MFASMLDSSFAGAVWSSIGTELVVFVVTLVFAFLIRAFNDIQHVPGKTKLASGCDSVAVVSKAPVAKPAELGDYAQRALGAALVASGAVHAARRPVRKAPAAVLDEIVSLTKEQLSLRGAGRALQLYHEELRVILRSESLGLQEIARFTQHSPTDMYTALVNCAIRVGQCHLVDGLLDDMVEYGVHRPLAFYESAMKQLARQKQYHLALAMYDRLAADGLQPSTVTCSCLVGFAAEVGEFQRAVDFFKTLSSTATPTIRAYMTVLRVHAKRQDFKASVETLRDMEKQGAGIDSLALNVVLAIGVAADQLDAVVELVAEADARKPPITDVVSYNTLVKGCVQRGNARLAYGAINQMKARGLQPNAITFNTAMDAAVRGGDVAGAWKLLSDMRHAGLRPDKFTCSIIVKGLAKSASAQQVCDALAVLKDAGDLCDQALKVKLYHSVFDAAAQASGPAAGVALQARAFAQMRSQNVTPSLAAQRLIMQALPGSHAERQG